MTSHSPSSHQAQNGIEDDIFRSRSPIKTIGGVLESSHRALSIRRIFIPIGQLSTDRLGQKQVKKVTSVAKFTAAADFHIRIQKLSNMTN